MRAKQILIVIKHFVLIMIEQYKLIISKKHTDTEYKKSNQYQSESRKRSGLQPYRITTETGVLDRVGQRPQSIQ